MKRISEEYVKSAKHDKFLFDLMEFKVPKLVYVQAPNGEVEILFIEMLRSFIKRNISEKELIAMSLQIVVRSCKII